jgi:multidrug transporter EmrE-like cation transporter
MSNQPKTLGIGRLLIAVYAVFAISSSARALYQLATKYEDAPLAYSLSALAAVVYVLATFALAKSKLQRVALFTITFELVGVVSVGLLSYTNPELFAHPSVWSKFGQGYGYVPLVLPILGLIWLRKIHKS